MFQGMDYIYEVYKEMSFSKAAKNLYISQPSLSAAVKKAEAQIGFPIFDRSTTPIRLTELGREYIRSVEIIKDVENGFRNYVSDVNGLKNGSLSIGGTHLFASYVLPSLISKFTEQYPQLHLELVEATTSELTEKLFSGSLDLFVDNKYMDPEVYEKKFFCKEHLLLVVPAEFESNKAVTNYAMTAADVRANLHLNSHIPPVPLDVFKNAPFIMLRPGNDTRMRAENICRKYHFTPRIKLESSQQITAYNLAKYGMGISFNGDLLVKYVQENNELIYYKLGNQDAIRDVNVYYKRNRYMTKAIAEFLKLI